MALRAADAVRLVLAGVCLARPTLPARLTRTEPTDAVVLVTRVLALRLGCQGAVGVLVAARGSRTASRRVLAADAVVEACHAATMVPAAAVFRDRARLAGASGVVAACAALADLRAWRRLSPSCTDAAA